MKRRLLLLTTAAALGACASLREATIQAPDRGFTSEWITTSLIEEGKAVRLEILVRKPGGSGPFPTVVFNHGSTGRGNDPSLFRRSWSSSSAADFFVERGWMVLFPQRRGRGASDGRYDEGFTANRSGYACEAARSLPGVDRAIEDLDAVMGHVTTRIDVVQGRVLIAGQSRGGILSIAYAGERPDAFVGVVNFVGGWMGDGCRDATAINASTFSRGARFPRRTLWLYGEDDPYYSLSHSKANFAAFLAAGGKGIFESRRVPGQNSGHTLIAHPHLWREPMDQYLASLR